MTFSQRLRQLVNERGVPINQLAREVGVTKQAFHGWLSGAVPRANRLEKLAEVLETSVQWLLFGNDEIKTVESEEGRILVPLLNAVHSAGNGSLVSSEEVVVRLLELDPIWAQEHLTIMTSTRNLALVHVMGDSMEPTLYNSDVILIDRGATRVARDGIYAAEFGEEFYIKRFQHIPGGKLVMISDNSFYQPHTFDPEDESLQFRVTGRALWVWQGKRLF